MCYGRLAALAAAPGADEGLRSKAGQFQRRAAEAYERAGQLGDAEAAWRALAAAAEEALGGGWACGQAGPAGLGWAWAGVGTFRKGRRHSLVLAPGARVRVHTAACVYVLVHAQGAVCPKGGHGAKEWVRDLTAAMWGRSEPTLV